MKTLAERPYNVRKDKTDRHRFLPYGQRHPAKMSIALALDLIRRYTRPGHTILDPCVGTGTTFVGMLLGRTVVGVELEPHHFRDAQLNARHLARIAQDFGSYGEWRIYLGDARMVVPTFVADPPVLDSTVTSGAFGEMNAPHRGGDIQQRPAKDGKGFAGGKEYFVYGADTTITSPAYADRLNETPEQAEQQLLRMQEKIAAGAPHPEGTAWGRRGAWGGGTAHRRQMGYSGSEADLDASITSPAYSDQMADHRPEDNFARRVERIAKAGLPTDPHHVGGPGSVYANPQNYDTPVDASVTSPAYADVASRDRHLEPFAQKDPARARKYGQDHPSRNVSGYGGGGGGDPAQIGNMRLKDGSYQAAMREVYTRCLEVTREGGVLVTVTGNYIDHGEVIDLAALTIQLCASTGWTPCERWRATKRNDKGTPQVSFWRTLQAKQGMPLIDWEDVLVFCRGPRPGWDFQPLDDGRWPG